MDRVDPHSKSGEAVRRMFDAIAPRYDLLNRLLSAGVDARWRRIAVDRALSGIDGADVLDLCCGTGDLALALARDARTRSVTGVDFAGAMLDRAERKRARSSAAGSKVRLLRGDALRIPAADRRFDVVTIAFGLRNLVDPEAGIREMVRVLRPGGRLAVLEFFAAKAGLAPRLFRAYFRHVLPRVGRWLSGTRSVDAYRYLPASVDSFANGDAVARWIESAGIAAPQRRKLLFGAVELIVAGGAGAIANSSEGVPQACFA
jgi:demethylmenaquinone methyltransferase/2-methoxy-6-polyprenyl-1,4-benzoquinol methylase